MEVHIPMKFLQFKFIPQSTDFALLVLRVWAGVTMLCNHGFAKLMNFSSMTEKFPDVIGIGRTPGLILIVFAEVACAVMISVGWLSRFAAVVLSIAMGVAFFAAHGMKLANPGSGELPFLYLAIFVTIFIAGPGRYSVDGKCGS